MHNKYDSLPVRSQGIPGTPKKIDGLPDGKTPYVIGASKIKNDAVSFINAAKAKRVLRKTRNLRVQGK